MVGTGGIGFRGTAVGGGDQGVGVGGMGVWNGMWISTTRRLVGVYVIMYHS